MTCLVTNGADLSGQGPARAFEIYTRMLFAPPRIVGLSTVRIFSLDRGEHDIAAYFKGRFWEAKRISRELDIPR